MKIQMSNAKEVVLSNCHGEQFITVLNDDNLWHIFVPCRQIEDRTGWKWISKTPAFEQILGIVFDYNKKRYVTGG